MPRDDFDFFLSSCLVPILPGSVRCGHAVRQGYPFSFSDEVKALIRYVNIGTLGFICLGCTFVSVQLRKPNSYYECPFIFDCPCVSASCELFITLVCYFYEIGCWPSTQTKNGNSKVVTRFCKVSFLGSTTFFLFLFIYCSWCRTPSTVSCHFWADLQFVPFRVQTRIDHPFPRRTT